MRGSPPDAKLDAAGEALLRTAQHEFPVVDQDERLLGVLKRDDMISALKKFGPEAPVVDFMRRDLPIAWAYDLFEQAFRQMQDFACPALPVVDSANRFAGLITPENVGEMLLVRSLRPANYEPAWRRPVAAGQFAG